MRRGAYVKAKALSLRYRNDHRVLSSWDKRICKHYHTVSGKYNLLYYFCILYNRDSCMGEVSLGKDPFAHPTSKKTPFCT